MSKTLGWGIIGAGSIACKLAEALPDVKGAKLVAIGSRQQKKADAFGDRYNIPHRHDSYEKLVGDPDVDVVYVATPHPMHRPHALLALKAGKGVLVEKPFTVNAGEASEVVRTARRKKLFCMEAMWSRFLPSVLKARELIAAGAIGDLRMVMADFGFRAGVDRKGRLFAPELAGGGLMDVGVYAVSFAMSLLGEPEKIVSLMEPTVTGVDGQAGIVMRHAGGELSLLATGVRTNTLQEATILGTDGHIRLHAPWWAGGPLTVVAGGKEKVVKAPVAENGFVYQCREVVKCVKAGRLESDIMPLDESLSEMKTLDAIRAQWGLKYPMERKHAKTAKKKPTKKTVKRIAKRKVKKTHQ